MESVDLAPVGGLELLDDAVARVTTALFEAYGLKTTPLARSATQPTPTPDPVLAAVIGYTSPELSGSLVLMVPELIAQKTAPPVDARGADWVAELVNQLLGRLKNQLLSSGVALQLSVPFVIGGRSIETASEGGYVGYYPFATEDGSLVVRVHAVFAAAFSLRPSSRPTPALEEGELLFF